MLGALHDHLAGQNVGPDVEGTMAAQSGATRVRAAIQFLPSIPNHGLLRYKGQILKARSGSGSHSKKSFAMKRQSPERFTSVEKPPQWADEEGARNLIYHNPRKYGSRGYMGSYGSCRSYTINGRTLWDLYHQPHCCHLFHTCKCANNIYIYIY